MTHAHKKKKKEKKEKVEPGQILVAQVGQSPKEKRKIDRKKKNISLA